MSEKLISPEDREALSKEFAEFKKDVEVMVIVGPENNEYTDFTINFVTELSEINDKIKLKVVNPDDEIAIKEKIDVFPYVFIGYNEGYRIEFMGAPLGYEARSLIEAVKAISTGKSTLSEKAVEKVKEVSKPVQVHVFVTPTCPYCPSAVIMAQAAAYENKNIRGICVEAYEAAELSDQFQVSSVPKIIFNLDLKYQFVGVQPEMKFITDLLKV